MSVLRFYEADIADDGPVGEVIVSAVIKDPTPEQVARFDGWSNGHAWARLEEDDGVQAHLPGKHDQQSHSGKGHRAVSEMTRNDMLTELKEHGYTGPTSYTKTRLGEIVEVQREETEARKAEEKIEPEEKPLLEEPPTPAPKRTYVIRGNMALEVQAEIEETLDEVAVEFPGLVSMLTVETGKLDSNVLAEVPRGQKKIIINERKAKKDITATIKRDEKTGYSVRTNDDVTGWKAVVVHELGHVIDNQVGMGAMNREIRAHKTLSRSGSLTALARSSAWTVSKYAATNHLEFVAESFAGYMLNDRPFGATKEMGKIVADLGKAL